MCRLVVFFFGLLALVTTWGQRVPQFSNRVVRCAGVYYPRLGCFSRLPPYNNTDRLPADPADVKTNFRLYTRSNPSTPDRLKSDDRSSISGSHMDASLPIKVLIHGFLQNGDMEFLVNMTQALLTHASANVLVVDWSAGAGFPYTQAVANARLVGAETALMLREVFDALGARADQVHVIGHSIGAHIAGYVGALVPEISRITGLDPAQPNYSGFDPAVRLDTSDAKFVDVIHTDAEPYTTVKGYGIIEPIGHVDFYPNGGRNQPGCAEEDSLLGLVEDVLSNGITTAEVDLTCSHERSTSLFTSSIIQSSASNGRQCHMTSFPYAAVLKTSPEESVWAAGITRVLPWANDYASRPFFSKQRRFFLLETPQRRIHSVNGT
ncbi:pancreatic triacylglycerol lipase-like [Physella acuta]|uniref:pancreatic triacylglycerol lipase-like n=1 Tax=Physella acuta TaxID=109671 RepID=UPI0027DB54FF|nr:pancreatic triacylglycerol lipase-like [Physella acuta]